MLSALAREFGGSHSFPGGAQILVCVTSGGHSGSRGSQGKTVKGGLGVRYGEHTRRAKRESVGSAEILGMVRPLQEWEEKSERLARGTIREGWGGSVRVGWSNISIIVQVPNHISTVITRNFEVD